MNDFFFASWSLLPPDPLRWRFLDLPSDQEKFLMLTLVPDVMVELFLLLLSKKKKMEQMLRIPILDKGGQYKFPHLLLQS